MWADIWTLIKELEQEGTTVIMGKVKAHADDDQLAPLPQRLGNQCADHHAGLAVQEVPASEVASVHWRDRKQTAIRERMMLALQMLPRRGRHPSRRLPRPRAI